MSIFYAPTSELYHYGVLGMKWGEHRAARKGGTYQYKSWGTKRNEFKSSIVQKKLSSGKPMSARKELKLNKMKAKFDRRAEISRDLDKREHEYSKPASAVGTIAGRVAMPYLSGGTIGFRTKQHQQVSAMISRSSNVPVSEINSFGQSGRPATVFVASTLTRLVPGTSHTVKAAYMRKGEINYIKEQFGTRKEQRERLKNSKKR
jgi:hypothetical protein